MQRSPFSYPRRVFLRWRSVVFLASALALTACGGGDDGNDFVGPGPTPPTASIAEAPPATPRTVVGTIDTGAAAVQTQAVTPGTFMTLDDGVTPIALDADGRFEIHEVADGNHSLFLRQSDGAETEIPFRMLEGRSLSLGTVQVQDGTFRHSGFNGFRFGFVDENNDGINDLMTDADGDGICDNAGLYAGYPYFMAHGFADANHDGINDRFRDRNGDGNNDDGSGPAGPGFGFLDSDGDGIADDSGMPFRHPFGYEDGNGDGINDRFRDADGDGVNDVSGVPYLGMPGWADLDNDGICDFFTDDNGDGIDDLNGMPYGHGFGWVDADGNGINDRFRDQDGDGRNDVTQGPLAGMPFHYGFAMAHIDEQGDGFDDISGMPYRHGFGWVDLNDDGINDAFADANGDGVNDYTGHHYEMGYAAGPGGTQGGHMGPGDWPMGPGHGPGNGPGMR